MVRIVVPGRGTEDTASAVDLADDGADVSLLLNSVAIGICISPGTRQPRDRRGHLHRVADGLGGSLRICETTLHRL